MVMTVVTAMLNNSSIPAEGFRHPAANYATVSDGHLTLFTHHGGDQVAIYPPKMWMQVFDGQTVEVVSEWKSFQQGEN